MFEAVRKLRPALRVLGLLAAVCASHVALPASALAEVDCRADAAPGVDWTDCEKKLIILRGADLSGAILIDVDFTSTDLRDTNLLAASLEKATLVRADFTDADITGSRFVLSNLARADFSKAKFTGAIDFTDSFFFLTRIDGLDLSQSSSLAQWQVDMSCGNAETRLPEGLKPSPDWPCNFD